jgi:hypothetical protein
LQVGSTDFDGYLMGWMNHRNLAGSNVVLQTNLQPRLRISLCLLC